MKLSTKSLQVFILKTRESFPMDLTDQNCTFFSFILHFQFQSLAVSGNQAKKEVTRKSHSRNFGESQSIRIREGLQQSLTNCLPLNTLFYTPDTGEILPNVYPPSTSTCVMLICVTIVQQQIVNLLAQ